MAENPTAPAKGWWRRLTTPSATWSVLALLIVGLVIGAAAVIGTQVMVAVTGTNEFCSNSCHGMTWVAQEYRKSIHYANPTGVQAGCHDCHIPHSYPQLLWVKAKAGVRDAIAEMRGVLATEDKFNKERLRLAKDVWADIKDQNAATCRSCHAFNNDVLAKQKEGAQPMHKMVLDGQAVCTDCHKGVAHTAPAE
jgi:nitrate/TMAO reductase-like tetraheme cytochrome c subunit